MTPPSIRSAVRWCRTTWGRLSAQRPAVQRQVLPSAPVAGPIGTAIGAAAGTLVGALAGRGVAETINPAQEDEYWCDTYKTRSYVDPDMTYADYGPAYRYGIESYGRHHGRDFDAVEPELGRGWEGAKGNSRLTWERAQLATKDAWRRLSDTLERATPGDSDGDHK